MTARVRLVGLLVVLVAALGGVLAFAAQRGTDDPAPPAGEGPPPGPPDAAVPVVDTGALVAGVPARAVAKLPAARVAAGVLPESNRWYSGLVFGDQPVFATPLSFAVGDGGFTIGLPQPVASAATVAGPHVPALGIDVGASSYRVSAADPVAVSLELLDDAGDMLGTVALAAGSPVVTFVAEGTSRSARRPPRGPCGRRPTDPRARRATWRARGGPWWRGTTATAGATCGPGT